MSFIKKLSSKKNNDVRLHFNNVCFLELSHEIENKLLAIRSAAGNLKRNLDLENSDFERKKDSLLSSLHHIDHMVNDAFKNVEIFSILEPQKFGLEKLKPENISILDTLHETVSEFPYKSSMYKDLILVVTKNEDIIISLNKKFFKILLERNIVEYFLLDLEGSLLMLSTDAYPIWLVVQSCSTVDTIIQIAKDAEVKDSIVRSLESKRKICAFFSDNDFNRSIQDWEKLLIDAHRENDMYYALVEGEEVYRLTGLSEKDFLHFRH